MISVWVVPGSNFKHVHCTAGQHILGNDCSFRGMNN